MFKLSIYREDHPDVSIDVGSLRAVREALQAHPPMRARGGVVTIAGPEGRADIVATSVHGTPSPRWSVRDRRIAPG